MIPNIYALAMADSALVGEIGERFYKHGSAPNQVATPYVTWFFVFGEPQNSLAENPSADRYTIQADVWADTPGDLKSAAEALWAFLESIGHVTGLVADNRDPTTMRYRYGLSASVWNLR